MYIYLFFIYAITTIGIKCQNISAGNNYLNQPRTNESQQGSISSTPKVNQNHRFLTNSSSDIYNHVLKQRKSRREHQNGQEENVINKDFSRNRLLAEAPRSNYVEVVPSRTIDYNFTSLGNDTNYLTAFGLRNKSKKNTTLLDFDKDSYIPDLKDPSANNLLQKVSKKQVSQNNWNTQSRNNSQNFGRSINQNEVDYTNQNRESNVETTSRRAVSRNRNSGRNLELGNGQRNQRPQNNQDDFSSRNESTSNISDSEAQGTFHNNNQVPQNNFDYQDFPNEQEDRSNFGRSIQTPSNVYGNDFNSFGGQGTTPQSNFQATTPFTQNFPQGDYGPPARAPTNFNVPTNIPAVPNVPQNQYGPSQIPVAQNRFTPGPVGPPSTSYGTPDDNIPQSSPGSFQSVPSPIGFPNQGQPSNTYGPTQQVQTPPSPQRGGYSSGRPQAPQNEGYPSGRSQAPQGGGYSSGRPQAPQNEGYPSGRPQGPQGGGYSSGRPQASQSASSSSGRPQVPQSEGYPSGRPQAPQSGGVPTQRPQTPQGEGYTSGRPQGSTLVLPTPRPAPVEQPKVQTRPSSRSKVHRHIYFHVAPPFEEEHKKRIKLPEELTTPEKHYKILFIKAPTAAPQTAIITPNQNEEKTLVYVLVKKPEEGDVNVVTPKPTPPSKPEVFFIRYKNKRDEGNSTEDGKDPGYDYPKPSNTSSAQESQGYGYPKPTIQTVIERKDTVQPVVAPVKVPVLSPVVPLVQPVPETIIQPQVHLPNYETYLTLNDYHKSYGDGLEAVGTDPGVIYHHGGVDEVYGANTGNFLLGQYDNVVFV